MLGVVHAPAIGQTYWGSPLGAFAVADGGPARADRLPADAGQGHRRRRQPLAPHAGDRRHTCAKFDVAEITSSGSSIKFCLVASGRADLYPRMGRTMEWDTAAGHAVVRFAGGSVITHRRQRSARYGKPGFDNPHFIVRGAPPRGVTTAPVVRPATSDAIAEAAALIRAGRLVAFPTETVYGLGGDAGNERAVAAIFAAKGRPRFNPLIVHVPDAGRGGGARRVIDARARRLAERFWPGPLTLVLPRRRTRALSLLVTAGLDTRRAARARRIRWRRRCSRAAGVPIAAPSANRSGTISPTRADARRGGVDRRSWR